MVDPQGTSPSTSRTWVDRLPRMLPTGGRLHPQDRERRHRWICLLLWGHVLVLPLIGVLHDATLRTTVLAGALLPAACATLACYRWLDPTVRAMLAAFGLAAASLLLVVLSDGMIELHFHAFAVVVLVSLYQSWGPFLLAVLTVIAQHTVVGVLVPGAMSRHLDAIERPVTYGLVNVLSVLAVGAACLVVWRLNEDVLAGERGARGDLERLSQELAAAQQIAEVGSWDWDSATDQLWWSEQMYSIAGIPTDERPSVALFLGLLHPEDRASFSDAVGANDLGARGFDLHLRLVRPNGDVRQVHCRGSWVADAGREDHLIGTCQDVTEQIRMEREIEYRAFVDPLTGLPNRARFLRLLSEPTEHDLTLEGETFVLCLDLDDFKTVNDTLGHSVGDRLLAEVADRLQGAVRPGDVVARLGGDEFAVLLHGVTNHEARSVASRLLTSLDAPVTASGHALHVRASLGAASTADAEAPEQLLQHADIALYVAKAQAPGTVMTFDPAMLERVTARATLESELASAIAEGELVVHYQPLFDLRRGILRGLEALVRWQHPTRGLLGPGEFIPLAEETGLIRDLGTYVLDRALTEVGALAASLGRRIEISVNVATQQLSDDLVAHVPLALARAGVRPADLTLEITESTLMDPLNGELDALWELRRQGVRIAIDDFGTGYSSLAYLRQMPIDRLKIDRAFVQELEGGEHDAALVATIVTLADTLGLDTVAEGIETSSQVGRLVELGCIHGQGFHLARPAPLDRLYDHLLVQEPAAN